jgi:AAA family ATP:ADP antiporter
LPTYARVKAPRYSGAGQTLLLLGVVPLYGMLAARMPRRQLINVVTIFFAVCLVGFFLVGRAGVVPLFVAIAYYLWLGIFSVAIIAQFWSFANDIYKREEGERLFPIVQVGGSLGAVAGSFIMANVIGWLGIYLPMLVAAAILVVSLLVTNYLDTRERRRLESDLPSALTTGSVPAASQEIPVDEIRKALTGEIAVEDVRKTLTGEISVEDVRKALEEGEAPARSEEEVRAALETTAQQIDLAGVQNPFMMVLRCRYLLLIGLLLLFLNWVNTSGEYILGKIVATAAADAVAAGSAGGLTAGEWIGTFYSNFFGSVNMLGLVLQLFLVSRVIKYLGVRAALMILPLIALGGYTLLAFVPVLFYVRWAKTAENATDYSLQNTVRQVLFLPCTREQKYKAKQAIDTFFVRAGDMFSAAVVFVGTTFLAMGPSHFAMFNIALVILWLAVALAIGREYKRLVASGRPPCVQT